MTVVGKSHRFDVVSKKDALLNVCGPEVNVYQGRPNDPFALWGCFYHCPSNQLFLHASHSILKLNEETTTKENLLWFSQNYLLPWMPFGLSISVANLICLYLFKREV
jgi:hypothetical protein